MGLFSSKSRSTTQNSDNRGAADNGSFVATGESSITTIEESEEALELAGTTISDAFDAIRVSNAQADDLARLALGQADRARTSDLKEIIEVAAPLALIVAGIVAWKVLK